MSSSGRDPQETSDRAGHLLVLEKLARILDCFTLAEPRLTFTQVRQRSALPASTCQRLLQSLVREGMLQREGDEYQVGMRIARWAVAATEGMDLVQRLRPVLTGVRDRLDETAVLFVRDRHYRTIADVVRDTHPIQRTVSVGQVAPLQDLGSGSRVFLAFDPAALPAVLATGWQAPASLEAELDALRREHYSETFEERTPGTGSASVPVLDAVGELRGALGIVAPMSRMSGPEDLTRIRAALQDAAGQATQLLGG